jgi:hypothetical protein
LFLYEVIESTKEKLVVKKHSEEIFILQRREETLELQINTPPELQRFILRIGE